MKRIDAPINSTFVYEDDLYIVEESITPTCYGCAFSDSLRERSKKVRLNCNQHPYDCTPLRRKDKSHVIFRIVK